MLAFPAVVPTRQPFVKGFVAALLVAVAVVTVGLTASAESPFAITIHTTFLRLGIDLDVKLGSFHLHASWSALSDVLGQAQGVGDGVNQTGTR